VPHEYSDGAISFVLQTIERNRSIVHDKHKLRETVNAVKACADNGTSLCQTNRTAYYRWMTIRQLGENGNLPPGVTRMLVQELGDDWADAGRPANNGYTYTSDTLSKIVTEVQECKRSGTSLPTRSTTYNQWKKIVVDAKQGRLPVKHETMLKQELGRFWHDAASAQKRRVRPLKNWFDAGDTPEHRSPNKQRRQQVACLSSFLLLWMMLTVACGCWRCLLLLCSSPMKRE